MYKLYVPSVYDIAVRPDGQKLYVAAGGKILVSFVVTCLKIKIWRLSAICMNNNDSLQLYHAPTGVFDKAVKAHKEHIYCLAVAKDGKLVCIIDANLIICN